jgi:hypothetical protein
LIGKPEQECVQASTEAQSLSWQYRCLTWSSLTEAVEGQNQDIKEGSESVTWAAAAAGTEAARV